MRRHVLLAGVTLAALLLAPRAHAQGIPVMDLITETNQTQQTVLSTTEVGKTILILAEAYKLYTSLNSTTNIYQISKYLTFNLTRMPLPTLATDVMGLARGVSNGGMLSGLTNQFLGATQYYRVPGTDPMALEINHGAVSTAGQYAIAQQAYQSNADRLRGDDDLQARLGSAATGSEKADIAARAAIENNRATAQTNQLLASQIAMDAEQRREKWFERERARKSADDMIKRADAVIASGGMSDPGG